MNSAKTRENLEKTLDFFGYHRFAFALAESKPKANSERLFLYLLLALLRSQTTTSRAMSEILLESRSKCWKQC